MQELSEVTGLVTKDKNFSFTADSYKTVTGIFEIFVNLDRSGFTCIKFSCKKQTVQMNQFGFCTMGNSFLSDALHSDHCLSVMKTSFKKSNQMIYLIILKLRKQFVSFLIVDQYFLSLYLM